MPQKSTQINANLIKKKIATLATQSINNNEAALCSTKAHKFKQMQQKPDIKNDTKKLAKAKSLQEQYQTKANESKLKAEQCSNQINKLQNQLNQLTNQPATDKEQKNK